MAAAVSEEIARLEQIRKLLCGVISHRNGTAERETVTVKKHQR